MAFQAKVFNVPASATALPVTSTDMRMGSSYIVRNVGSLDVTIGGADVNATDKGFPLKVGESLPITIDDGEIPYFFGGVGGSIAVLAQGV